MMGWKRVVSIVVVAVVAQKVWKGLKEPPPPTLDPNPWWGPGQPLPEDTSIRQFKIDIPQEDLDDLYTRLALPSRLTPGLEGANFTYGFNGETLGSLVEYWHEEYNWREREARLNTHPHYRTRIEGLDIHFVWAKAHAKQGVTVVPLLLLHGWPGSFVEFTDILPLLTHPGKDSKVAFEVICPSIPGYGFSQPASKQGLGATETAQIYLKLMKRLGFEKFFVQGGDWGSVIATDMATLYPENVRGVHLNMFAINTKGATAKILLGSVLPSGLVVDVEDEHLVYPLLQHLGQLLQETGYLHIQATKPDTVGAAVNQSPAGLAAYILEKFSTATAIQNTHLPDGGLLHKDFPISRDAMLDNICIYWFTGTITTSMRFYAENAHRLSSPTMDRIPCRVPAGFASFPREPLRDPRSILGHKFYDIATFRRQPAGGHFAAMEEPQLLAADIHNFVKEVLKRP